MSLYQHEVQYYETDRMGITHHSNYIRWMEEARVAFLKDIGWDYVKLEEMGIISPVIDVQCQYKNTTTFADKVMIETTVKKFSGIKLILQYEMKNEAGKIVALAESAHCFLDKDGKMLRLAKQFPAFYQALCDEEAKE